MTRTRKIAYTLAWVAIPFVGTALLMLGEYLDRHFILYGLGKLAAMFVVAGVLLRLACGPSGSSTRRGSQNGLLVIAVITLGATVAKAVCVPAWESQLRAEKLTHSELLARAETCRMKRERVAEWLRIAWDEDFYNLAEIEGFLKVLRRNDLSPNQIGVRPAQVREAITKIVSTDLWGYWNDKEVPDVEQRQRLGYMRQTYNIGCREVAEANVKLNIRAHADEICGRLLDTR